MLCVFECMGFLFDFVCERVRVGAGVVCWRVWWWASCFVVVGCTTDRPNKMGGCRGLRVGFGLASVGGVKEE